MKTAWAALLVTFVATASPAVAQDVPDPKYVTIFRPTISYFAGAEKAAPGNEFYRMENAENISPSTKHSRNGNTAPGPPGGQHSYLFLAVEGYATGQLGISSDGREGALAYANLTDASASRPNTVMAYGFSVYLPSELYSYGDDYPPWVEDQPVYDDRIFKLTSTTLPWLPVLEISANRHQFTITYRGGSFDIGTLNGTVNRTEKTTPDLCKQTKQTDPVPYFPWTPYRHARVALGQSVAMGESTANVWHDFVVFYKASSSGSDGQIVVWHRTLRGPSEPWNEWLTLPTPPHANNVPNDVRTAFYERNYIINPGTVAAWGYERPSYCYGTGDIVPGCGSGNANANASANSCEIADFSTHQPNSGLYIDNIVVGSDVVSVKKAFPSLDTGF